MIKYHLSSKNISPNERLIVTLDIPDINQAKELVDKLGDSVQFYKIGLELFMTGRYFGLVKWLQEKEKRILIDLKFFDVPETVASAVRQLHQYGADFVTVHGNDSILKAAVREKNETKILAVTVLTSLDQGDMEDLGFDTDINEVVLSRAQRALDLGCDGIISSGLKAQDIYDSLDDNFMIVVPDIRPGINHHIDNHKYTVDIESAFYKGADYIVVGHPIHSVNNPKAAAENIQDRIRKLFVT